MKKDQMIKCDNVFVTRYPHPQCPTEWFHFYCVKLTQEPKGEWLCPQCERRRKLGIHIFT